MSTVVQPNSAFSRIPETLSNAPASNVLVPSVIPFEWDYYEIEDIRRSECALVLFTRHAFTSERVVMKILCEYKDSRYSLATLGKRQQCQLEALRRNRVFTPEVYIGLAPIIGDVDVQGGRIHIGECLKNPTQQMLDPETEYTLLMYQLPHERRLDALLKENEGACLRHAVRLLTHHVASIHTRLPAGASREDGLRWGSDEQVYEKLLHNFGLLELLLTRSHHGWYRGDERPKETIARLEKMLLDALKQGQDACYFEQRVQGGHIRYCHGDLKSPNIWMLSCDERCDEQGAQSVKLLDAIDFNPMYSSIDTLSDFAMLVIDVQVRTKSVAVADEMIESYLELTGQQDEGARWVLDYYLVEKALVGAAISVVYDQLPQLGCSLLEAAEMRLNCLVSRRHFILAESIRHD